ncbi:MAG: rod shape-determining protein MreC [Synergistaceae bacterium]|jgi:rod shape-determining protein MreC|nr:rod shape-determining protein MreC [Synergistaceae bacterium]
MSETESRKVRIQGVIAVILALLLLGGSAGTPFKAGLERIVLAVLDYPERPIRLLLDVIIGAGGWVEERATLLEAMATLREENLHLRRRVEEGKIPPLPTEKDEKALMARVLFRSPRAWWKEIRIDRGSRDGIRLGDPALSDGFLIGRVTQVEHGFSTVELLTSSGLLVPVVVDQTRDLGVVTGDEVGQVHLLYLPLDRRLEKGMSLSTALVSERVPPGLPVGFIADEEPDDGAFRPYRVRLGADLTRLYRLQIWLSGEDDQP